MSSQSDLDGYPYQYILRYVFLQEGKSPLVHQTDLSDVGTASYNIGTGHLQIDTWLLVMDQPSMETLMTYTLVDVLVWYHSYYETPVDIFNTQFLKLTSTELAAVRTDSSMIGFVVFNTTAQANQYWTGSAWINCYQ